MFILKNFMSKSNQIKLQRKINEMEKRIKVDNRHPTVFFVAYLYNNKKAVEMLSPYLNPALAKKNKTVCLCSVYLSAIVILVSYIYSLSAEGIVYFYDRFLMYFAGIFFFYACYKAYNYFNSKCFWELYQDSSKFVSKSMYEEYYKMAVSTYGKDNIGECCEDFQRFLR